MPHSADELLRRHARLLSERVVWESHWAEVAQHVLPRSDFFMGRRNPGEKHTEKIYDATACLALERFTASMESMFIPRTQRWHGLRSQRAELKEDPEVRVWLDSVCDLLFAMRYAPRANFTSQTNDAFMSVMGAFGTGVMFIESEGDELRYRSVHISEVCIAENAHGLVDTVFRKALLTARQAVQRFGVAVLPEKIVDDARERPDALHEFVHVVLPNWRYYRGTRRLRRAIWPGKPRR
jgi:hypothetical protein